MQNRVADAIEICRIACLEVASEKLDALSPKLDMDIREHATWQEKKSIRQMEGRITMEEAELIYRTLGGMPSVYNRQPIHVKIAIIKVLQLLVV